MTKIVFYSLVVICCGLVTTASVRAADLPAVGAAVDAPATAISPKAPAGRPPLYARIVIDSIYCERESKWDHLTSQDEPYLMVLGIATHRDPISWNTGRPQVFRDVDTGNNRRFTTQRRVIYEGEVPPGAVVGFQAIMWEKDASSDNAVMRLADKAAHSIHEWIKAGEYPNVKKDFPRLMVALWPYLISAGVYLAGGGDDDKIGEQEALFDYEDLTRFSERPHRALRMVFDGGDEGKYWLRYHVEFGEDATRELGIRFTEWDDVAVGNVGGVAGDEIVVVSDKEGAGGSGRFFVYDGQGKLVRSFDAPYSRFDRLAVANVEAGTFGEILVASPAGGGTVRSYDHTGALKRNLKIPFTKYDGFAVGNVVGDDKAEIIIARDDDRKVLVCSRDGEKLDEFGLDWPFKGVRYTASDTRHDAFLVGDVLGDGKAEIVMIQNKNSNQSVIRVYNGKGAEVRKSSIAGEFGATFTNYDAAALGDVHGDAKKELLIAVSDDEKSYSYTTYVLDLASGKQVGTRHWPWYSKHDGFAAGSLLGGGKQQIVVASIGDKTVYVGR